MFHGDHVRWSVVNDSLTSVYAQRFRQRLAVP